MPAVSRRRGRGQTSYKTTDQDCSRRITPDLAIPKRIGRSNRCRRRLDKTSLPVTQERLPVDGGAVVAATRIFLLTGKSLAW